MCAVHFDQFFHEGYFFMKLFAVCFLSFRCAAASASERAKKEEHFNITHPDSFIKINIFSAIAFLSFSLSRVAQSQLFSELRLTIY
jgi:hypothetical protein